MGQEDRIDAAVKAASPSTTGWIAVLDGTGDTKTMWDKTDPASVEKARQVFDTLTSQGHLAYESVGTGHTRTATQIKKFNPDAERVVVVRPLMGG